MPKRTNIRRTSGGAEITRLNELHNKLVETAFQALENEIAMGEIKPSTLNSVRQICADCGVQPTHTAMTQLEELNSMLPNLDLAQIGRSYSNGYKWRLVVAISHRDTTLHSKRHESVAPTGRVRPSQNITASDSKWLNVSGMFG